MSEKITLTGVPETMLQTVYARAQESAGRGAIRDETAEQIIGSLDYDFSLAEKDTAMRSGVIARTIVLDRLVGASMTTSFLRISSLRKAGSSTSSIRRIRLPIPRVHRHLWYSMERVSAISPRRIRTLALRLSDFTGIIRAASPFWSRRARWI